MRKIKTFSIICSTMAFFSLTACSTIPKGVEAVTAFEQERYLGKWYEIARFDFRFERNLNNTTAFYELNPDNSIKVVNRGYNYVTNEWKKATGKAKFVEKTDVAMLKVSFFGPFYAGYNVIAIDKNYQYALVSGSSLKYLWILSRTPQLPQNIKEEYLQLAHEKGFKVENLIWVEHNQQE